MVEAETVGGGVGGGDGDDAGGRRRWVEATEAGRGGGETGAEDEAGPAAIAPREVARARNRHPLIWRWRRPPTTSAWCIGCSRATIGLDLGVACFIGSDGSMLPRILGEAPCRVAIFDHRQDRPPLHVHRPRICSPAQQAASLLLCFAFMCLLYCI